MKQIQRNLYALTDGSYPVNAHFLVSGDGVVVFDSLTGAASGSEIIGAIRSVTEQPIRFLINTHEHWDHVFGNGPFAAIPGCLLIGPDEVRRVIAAGGPAIVSPELHHFGESVQVAAPSLTFSSRMTIDLGDERIELELLGGHSPGSAVAWLPGRQVLLAGDNITGVMPPFLGSSSLPNWIAALDRMRALGPRVILPGHGEPQLPEMIDTLRVFLQDVRELAAAGIREGLAPTEIVERLIAAMNLPDRQRSGLLAALPGWMQEL